MDQEHLRIFCDKITTHYCLKLLLYDIFFVEVFIRLLKISIKHKQWLILFLILSYCATNFITLLFRPATKFIYPHIFCISQPFHMDFQFKTIILFCISQGKLN